LKFNEFYLLTENFPFTVAITVVAILSFLEGVMLLLGLGMISFLDNLLPDLDLDIDGPTLENHGLVSKTLTFLKIKNVPLIILFVAFMMSYGMSGLIIQGFCIKLFGTPLSSALISIPAFFIGITLMKGFGEVLAKIMPADETDARKIEEYAGKMGVITLGVSKKGNPAQCKVREKNGATHYFMALPDNEGEEIHQGEKVLLVRFETPYFYVIKPDNKNL
jgi:hypothetical protein